MKHVCGSLLIQLLTIYSIAQTPARQYMPADQGSTVAFTIKNFGFNTGGTFSGLQGTISLDPQDVSKASFDVSVDAATVNTGNDLRDDHLRKDGYFDVQKYPRIRFVS